MPKGKVYFSTDASPEGMLGKAAELVLAGEPAYILDDFKNGYKGCKTVAEYIKKLRPDLPDDAIIVIHGDNSGSDENKDFIENINEESLSKSLICVSPSVVQGVSLENGHFKHVFAFINGILTDKKVMQGISRVRGGENTYIWVAEKGCIQNSGGAITAVDVNNYYQSNYKARNNYIHQFGLEYNELTEEFSSPHWELRCKNLAYTNLVMRRLRYWVQQRLEGLGYELIPTEFGVDKAVSDLCRDLWKEITIEEALRIGDAKILDKLELEKLLAKIRVGESLKPSIYKVFGEELTAKIKTEVKTKDAFVVLTGYAAVAYKNRNRDYERNLMRAFNYLYGGAKDAAQRDIAKETQQREHGGVFVGDLQWTTRELEVWERLNIKQYFVPDKKFSALNFYRTYEQMQAIAVDLGDGLIASIAKEKCGNAFGRVLDAFGFDRETARPVDDDGKRNRIYWITEESLVIVAEFCYYQLEKKQPNIEKDKTTAAQPLGGELRSRIDYFLKTGRFEITHETEANPNPVHNPLKYE
ncbi:hypothetical protein [Nostoc sp.]